VSRGYTWSEDGYPVTQPNSRFRLASLSKAFTAAGIRRLVSMGRLAPNTQAYPFLGITNRLLPDQTPDPAVNTITVDHLVNRRGGLTHARVTENGVVRLFEPSDDLRTVAARLGRTTLPTRDDLVRYMYGEPLDFAPGTQQVYSNFAFTLLTSIVERASGQGFVDFVRREVLAPMGLADLWAGASTLAGRVPDEVRYDHPGVGLTVLQPTAQTLVPNVYGTFALENSEGTGGLVSTAPTVARFITRHAVWDGGPRLVATRHGTFDGATTGARSRPDNLDFAYLFNRRVTDPEHDGITNAIDAYLTAHPA
jgi:N-acyl-D-amino-acid deacylase